MASRAALIFGCLVYSSNTTVIQVARNIGVGDVIHLYALDRRMPSGISTTQRLWLFALSAIGALHNRCFSLQFCPVGWQYLSDYRSCSRISTVHLLLLLVR